MTSINETSLILLALDKALLDNARNLTDQERKALVLAVFKMIMQGGAAQPNKGAAKGANG